MTASSLPLYTEALFDDPPKAVSFLAQQNYSDIIATVEAVPLTQASYAHFICSTDLRSKEMTDLEVKHLSLYRLTKWYDLGCEVAISSAFKYVMQFGEVPADGMQLIESLQPELFTETGLSEFRKLPREEQLVKIRHGVNPSTGRLIESFTDEDWHPFGICITKLQGRDAIVDTPVPPNRLEPGEDFRTEPRQGWRIVVFGEKSDTVLIDKVIHTMVYDASAAASGGCSCGAKE